MQDFKRWLRWMKGELLVGGWRFDFVKGYSGRHVSDYIKATDPGLAVGEFWDDCAYDKEGVLLPNQVQAFANAANADSDLMSHEP